MRPPRRHLVAWVSCLFFAAQLLAPLLAHAAVDRQRLVDSTWVDGDGRPIPRPPDGETTYWGERFHRSITEPVAHIFDVPDKLLLVAHAFGARTRREAVNVNAFDEVPNSSWFTNRNHVRAIPVAELAQGPDGVDMPRKPWTIKHPKEGGVTEGFQVLDADGRKWLIKLDPRGYAQIGSGADMVARTLYHAAGYNVPHNEPVRFRREDLVIAPDLLKGAKGERYTEADLDSALAWGAQFADGSYSACASLFIAGHIVGSPSTTRRRRGDANDWYAHVNRRELRGLFVISSWLGNWDTEDHQFLDSFVATEDSLGHIEHYVLDVGSTFGASATGPKLEWDGYEYGIDYGWIGRRFVTLGFAEEPWRRAHQETGISSVGRFESAIYTPQGFKPGVQQMVFRAMTDRDGYWGAKIVASFSDAQIAAAVDAAHYEDPRARDFLVRNIITRRDKIARYWFARVAPLDFFTIEDGTLRFHDLASELGLAGTRGYDVEFTARGTGAPRATHLHAEGPSVPLAPLGDAATQASLVLSIAGERAQPTRVELTRAATGWVVTRVRHA